MAWKSGQSYSADLRSRVLAAVDGGLSAKTVAARYQVSVSYIDKALGRRDATGETEARPQRNHQQLKLAAQHEAIAAASAVCRRPLLRSRIERFRRSMVAQRPDVTLNELRAWLLATHSAAASLGLMHRTLARLGLTLKKSRSGPRSRTGPISPSSARIGGAARVS